MAKAISDSTSTRVERPSRESPSLTSVGFLLHVARARLGEEIRAAIEGSGLHPGHLGVLGALTDAGPMNQRRLCELTLIDKSSMVLFLDALEDGGWIRRVRDPNDRRAHIVEMTKAGAARFAALGSKLKDVQDRFLAPLEKAEREQLIDFLSRLGADKL
jgi:DNA-binding MarR family transcriptional regulator